MAYFCRTPSRRYRRRRSAILNRAHPRLGTPTRVALGGEAHRRIDGMTAPFAWAAPSGQAPTPAGGAPPLRRDGLDGEGARQAIIVVAPDAASPPLKSGSVRPTGPRAYPTASATLYSARVAETGTLHSNPMSIARRQARSRSRQLPPNIVIEGPSKCVLLLNVRQIHAAAFKSNSRRW
jgi:hypothetical protein